MGGMDIDDQPVTCPMKVWFGQRQEKEIVRIDVAAGRSAFQGTELSIAQHHPYQWHHLDQGR
jgi:hypothetical protein